MFRFISIFLFFILLHFNSSSIVACRACLMPNNFIFFVFLLTFLKNIIISINIDNYLAYCLWLVCVCVCVHTGEWARRRHCDCDCFMLCLELKNASNVTKCNKNDFLSRYRRAIIVIAAKRTILLTSFPFGKCVVSVRCVSNRKRWHKPNCGFVDDDATESDKDNDIGKPKNVVYFVLFSNMAKKKKENGYWLFNRQTLGKHKNICDRWFNQRHANNICQINETKMIVFKCASVEPLVKYVRHFIPSVSASNGLGHTQWYDPRDAFLVFQFYFVVFFFLPLSSSSSFYWINVRCNCCCCVSVGYVFEQSWPMMIFTQVHLKKGARSITIAMRRTFGIEAKERTPFSWLSNQWRKQKSSDQWLNRKWRRRRQEQQQQQEQK